MNQPINSTPAPKDPPKDGITPHLRRIDDLIRDLGNEIQALQRIEKSLKDAHDRLERHTNLMDMETQLIGQLLKRDGKLSGATPIKAVPYVDTDKLADKIEEDLKQLVPAMSAPVVTPIAKR